MPHGILIIGFIFNASQYPGIWLSSEPNGVDDATGRYLVLTRQGLKDVGNQTLIAGGVCMLENKTYRLDVRTMKYYRMDTLALVIQSVARATCELEGGRLAIPYGVNKRQAVDGYGSIIPTSAFYFDKFIWMDGTRANISSMLWMLNDGKATA
jgi:hypothetical protein